MDILAIYLIPAALLTLLLARRLYLCVKYWRWQQEHPREAWQNWLNGG